MRTADDPRSRDQRAWAALTIAGSDSGGGAGIQADLRTFAAHGLLGCSAITAVTAQNTLGVRRVDLLPPAAVTAQIGAVLDDLPVRAAKTGMLATAEIVEAVAAAWAQLPAPAPLVVDPVMIAKGGHPLLADTAVAAILHRLLPLATVITPNLPEAAALLGRAGIEDPAEAAEALAERVGDRATIVIKGGHAAGADATDVVRFPDGRRLTLSAPRVDTRCDHGTGCSLSAAITARLALGEDLDAAIAGAKAWLTGALRSALPVGAGHSPVDHLWALRGCLPSAAPARPS